jgi:GMP synthase-like glutamine amidotransferase
VRILSLIHQDDAPSGVFAEVARERGDELVAWNAEHGVPPEAADEYDAFLVFGGSLQVDEEDRYPWLRPEGDFLQEVLERGAPAFGVCLGGQLIAKAAGAHVGPAPQPEIGWHQVGLTPAAAEDPVFGALPERFDALQWHSYAFELPPGAVALAESPVCLQGYRVGERAWGVQFHPEVNRSILEGWIALADGDVPKFDFEPLPAWERLGRRLATAFYELVSPRG